MDASQVTISPDTLRFKPMSKGKRTKLRRQAVIDLIKSKPYGTPIILAEFSAVTQLKGTAAAWGLVKTMLKHGTISRDEVGPKKYAYRVNGSVRTTKLLPPPAQPTAPTTEIKPTLDLNKLAYRTLVEVAKEYYWETASNDLHGFVEWLGKKENT